MGRGVSLRSIDAHVAGEAKQANLDFNPPTHLMYCARGNHSLFSLLIIIFIFIFSLPDLSMSQTVVVT